MITHLSYFEKLAKKTTRKKLVVAAAEDENVLKAVNECYQNKFVNPILFGNTIKIKFLLNKLHIQDYNIEIVDVSSPEEAAYKAVEYIRNNPDSILMKGLVKSNILLKEIIKKDTGLLTGKLLSHVGLIESPYYHKILGITDGAININPNLQHKIEIIKNAIIFFNNLGYQQPKVAVLGAIEKKNEKIESTVHAAEIKNYFVKNNIKNCIIDGPLALDNAISESAAKSKKIKSEVAGDADILVAPNIDAGNILYKSLNFLGGSTTAGVIIGGSSPVVFTSRADSHKTKYMSVILACIQ
ncbi:bifunctional enoyl-CoA hydratase/phosphate acetyltransferase [Bacteroidota bacterium]